ncbi:peptidase S16 lon domain protein [Anaeromyxobacter sp. K]|uniref:LON peptidase substrate-binding domain-containing protein n=1 Tax=Anaeromyxobacter sp. (strain K) TaxID=447217 RepID=UPI00015F90B9|nr:LON peptidase substrate-binding domain-containing protein [Anaeromyxobacter sp. K]ACG75645.1 peptidase S16 lon domain protein [Anaeromyxobacter sp. K]
MCAERIAPPSPRAALEKACAALKVFPLHGVVVLPGTPTPFHIFEPRYRALVADALRGDRILAVPGLTTMEAAQQLHPPLFPVAGACVIEQEERYDDGRYDLVVRGVARVRLIQELANEKPYREFRAEILDDVWPDEGPEALEPDVASLRQLVLELSTRLPPESGAPALAEAVAQMRDASAIADLVAAAAVSEPHARQRVLETLEVERRLELVVEEVAGVVLLLSKGQRPEN